MAWPDAPLTLAWQAVNRAATYLGDVGGPSTCRSASKRYSTAPGHNGTGTVVAIYCP